MGGFLQAVVFGYGGLRLHPDKIRLNPKLPENVTKLRVRGLHYRGNVIDFTVGSTESEICVRSADIEARLLVLQDVESGEEYYLDVGKVVTFSNGPVIVKEYEQNTVVT
jgi:trehalose/maltose hydrolase-like predicted phosphorylase